MNREPTFVIAGGALDGVPVFDVDIDAAHRKFSPTCHHRRATMTLHRAIVSSRVHDEHVVFFEPPHVTQASAFLRALLQAAWNVPAEDLEIYNVQPARDVFRDHEREGWDRPTEIVLLETGGNGFEVQYARPSNTMFLCHPHNAASLRRAQDDIDRCEWRKVPARCHPSPKAVA